MIEGQSDGHDEAIIQLRGVTKRFGGVVALDNVSFDIAAGEVHAIVGENGAGKSTLMKIIAGVHQPDSGAIYLKGRKIEVYDPLVARQLGISIVFQQLHLFPDLTVAGNIFIKRELTGGLGLLDERTMRRESEEVLKLMGVETIDPSTLVADLTAGEQQVVAVGRALQQRAEIIIMDEPNSALTDRETKALFDIIRRLKAQGITILYVSHRLEEVFQIADRISVIRDGHYVGTWNRADTTVAEIIAAMIGRRLEEKFPERPQLPDDAPVILEVKGLAKHGKLEPTDFQVREGEILGFAGLQGCGIETLFQLLFGLEKPDAGEVIFLGRKQVGRSPADIIRTGWGLVPADRHRHGLMVDWSLRQNVSLVILRKLVRRLGLIDNGSEENAVLEYVRRLNIVADSIDKTVLDLSGGNQQKVVVAKWLATGPKVLILDDPTRGIDVGAKAEIYDLITRLAEQGLAILFTSSELDEVLGLSDRVLVLYRGEIVGEFRANEVSKAEIGRYVAGAGRNSESRAEEAVRV